MIFKLSAMQLRCTILDFKDKIRDCKETLYLLVVGQLTHSPGPWDVSFWKSSSSWVQDAEGARVVGGF